MNHHEVDKPPRGISHERMINEIDAQDNTIDRRILYELIRYKHDPNEYQDESSFSDEPDD